MKRLNFLCSFLLFAFALSFSGVSVYAQTKSQIKEAVEKMFAGAKVAKVNTMNNEGKRRRVRGTMQFGKTAKTKKAIVQLTAESADIEIFEGL